MACVINNDILAGLLDYTVDYTDDDQIAKIAKVVDNAVPACLVERSDKFR